MGDAHGGVNGKGTVFPAAVNNDQLSRIMSDP